MPLDLPIDSLKDKIVNLVQKVPGVVIQSPAGSGKSTRVPQFLADHLLPANRQVLVLEPRRMAARILANWVAAERGSETGLEVGYHIRFENCSQPDSRIVFLTEGVLLRRLFSGDRLEQAGVVIFDEFHERHLETDLTLSMVVHLQKTVRPDLKWLIMSATVQNEQLPEPLRNTPVITSTGRSYGVTIHHCKTPSSRPVWENAAETALKAAQSQTQGSILIFMPGGFEIRKTIETIGQITGLQAFTVLPLYGGLPKQEQDRALRSNEKSANRKIIVATNVAETSLTIDGVTAVIDSGTAKVARFDPTRGVNGLFLEPISRSSADQRAGRAGRTAPGICYRLWPIEHHESRPLSIEPEIHRIDLSGTLLGILAAGFSSPGQFPWLEKPEASRILSAMELLRVLGAVSESGQLTPIGKQMAELPFHPRWARVLTEARALGVWDEASLIVAISQSGELYTKTANSLPDSGKLTEPDLPPSDLICAGYVLASRLKRGRNMSGNFDWGIAQRDLQEAEQTFRQLAKNTPQTPFSKETTDKLLQCLLCGFPDHIARHVASGSPHYKTASGVSGQLASWRIAADAPYILYSRISATLTGSRSRVFLQGVSVVEPEWIETQCRAYFSVTDKVEWVPSMQRVMEKRETGLGELIWKQTFQETFDDDTAAELLAQLILNKEISFPAWDESVERFLGRVRFTARHNHSPGIEDIDDEAFRWILQQAIYKTRSAKEVAKRELWPSLHAWLRPGDKEMLNWFAPESIQLPGRRRPTPLRYCENGEVILSDTIQNLYDCPTPITVAGGHTEVLYELLAPSRRPVQLTANLDAFWRGSYKEIRKELKWRYPKHEWLEF